jgi:MSHA biogenesis protein MshP
MKARGFVLMAALFLIVTFAAIGAYLVTISTGQIEAATQDEQAARAYLAARAGIDWGAYQVLRNPTGAFATATCVTPLAAQALPLGVLGGPAAGEQFRASITCVRSTETERGETVEVFVITSTACNRVACGGAGDSTYVERQLQLVLAK